MSDIMMSDMDSLFPVPALSPRPTCYSAKSAKGAVAEHLAVARLLDLGHKVAIPVVDDDGVDLVVNYHLKVQVKSCAARQPNGVLIVQLRRPIRADIDVLLVYARDVDRWWVIPGGALPTTTRQLYLPVSPKYRAKNSRLARYQDAWAVFGAD